MHTALLPYFHELLRQSPNAYVSRASAWLSFILRRGYHRLPSIEEFRKLLDFTLPKASSRWTFIVGWREASRHGGEKRGLMESSLFSGAPLTD